MGPIAAAAIPAAADFVGSLFGFGGQQAANQANAREAQKNRDFQERMSNTSYQRGVADLKAAGLNPALAYQHAGASSPGGSTAQMQNAAGHIGSGISSAGQFQQRKAELDLVKEQARRTATETQVIGAKAKYELAILDNEAKEAAARGSMASSPDYTALLRRQLDANLNLTNTNARHAGANARLAELGIPQAQAEANKAGNLWGRLISPYLNDAKTVAGIGASLAIPGAISKAGTLITRSGKTVGTNIGKIATAKQAATQLKPFGGGYRPAPPGGFPPPFN